MNEYDAARLYEILRRSGYAATDDLDQADLIILNTCSIRAKAETRVIATASGLQRLKARRPDLVLAIAGCVAQQEGARLLERLPHVDLVFGPDSIARCAELVEDVRESRRRVAVTDVIDVTDYTFLSADPRPEDVGTTALCTIQKGCDNRCAYCVVPSVRGREVSRPLPEVVAEVERFVAAGAREVTLIGQNVNSYRGAGGGRGDGAGSDGGGGGRGTAAAGGGRGDGAGSGGGGGGASDFVRLLEAVARVPGLLRLRFTTSHPRDFTPALARAFRDLPVLQGWLHLPVQAGSTRVLAAMGRGYTREEYLAKVDLVRELVPEIALTTDVIVGFPGETVDDYRETLSLLEAVEFESIYSFAYSPRPGTPAAALRDDVPAVEKRARLHEVQALQQRVTARRLTRLVGRQLPVLVEGGSRRGEEVCGRTPGNVVVNFAPSAGTAPGSLRGTIVPVRVTAAGTHTLRGELA